MNENLPELPANSMSGRTDTISYLVTAVVFFALGFLVAYFVGVGGAEESPDVSAAVESTLIAMTPSPTPLPTRAPVQLTYSDKDYRLGSPDAPIKIVEFSDYQCPWCSVFARNTLHPLMEKFEGQIEFVYRDYPIFGEMSERSALAARCADHQNKFWEYHDELFTRQYDEESRITLDEAMLQSIAVDLGMDVDAFNQCLADPGEQQALNANILEGQQLIGGYAGTPLFLINGSRYSGAYPIEDFVEIINFELRELGIDPVS